MSKHTAFNSVSEAVEALKQGKPVIVVDDEDRENEGDFVCLAETITPELVNLFITEGKGLVCVALDEQIAHRLALQPMVDTNRDPLSTAFTVSVDHKDSTTGISAFERAQTIQALGSRSSEANDFTQPGHIFPLVAKQGGVLVRRGHTEASVDLAKLAGSQAAAVICEILKPNGEMARRDDLLQIAKRLAIPIITIEALVQFRQNDAQLSPRLVREAVVQLPAKLLQSRTANEQTVPFQLVGYRDTTTDQEHLALVNGTLTNGQFKEDAVPLVRIHSECITGDVFGSCRCDCGPQLAAAQALIAKQTGVILYMREEGRGIGLINKLKAYQLQEQGLDTVEANLQLGFAADQRDYHFAAMILKDLGINRIRLLTNNPEKLAALKAAGIEVVERIGLHVGDHPANTDYKLTKIQKMHHFVD